jgi:hypothetical protein
MLPYLYSGISQNIFTFLNIFICKEFKNMDYFTLEDLNGMFISKIEYDPENKGWEFYVIHNNNEYYLKDFTLPDPENVINENIVAKVTELMLRVKNVSTKEEPKKKYEVIVEDFKDTPLTNLDEEDYVRPDYEDELFEFNGIGGSNLFVDNLKQFNFNIHILFNSKSFYWRYGKYSKSNEWAYDDRVISVNGKVIKLTVKPNENDELTWEYLDEYYTNKMEYNGVAGKQFFTDGINYFKFNIHIILDMKSLLWYFGPNNTDKSWIDKYGNRTVLINGYTIELGNKRNENGLFYFEVLKEPKNNSNIIEFNGMITRDMLIGEDVVSKYNVHLLLDTDTMTWDYGPDNEDGGWLGEGKQIYIQGDKVSLSTKRGELGYDWEYL